MSIINRTGYSFRSATGNLKKNFSKIVQLTGHALITDTSSTFAWVRWNKMAKKANVKPVFGVEIAVSESINETKPSYDHWVFIAKDDIKYINRLVALSSSQFRYVPMLTFDQANNAEGVYKIAGPRTNYDKLAPDVLIGLSPALNFHQLKKAMTMPDRLIAASDPRYIEAEDKDLYLMQLGRDSASQTYPQHLMGDDEWVEFMTRRGVPQDVGQPAWELCQKVLTSSTATIKASKLLSPEHPKPLLDMCLEGAKRVGCNLEDPIYKERLKYELDLIESKKFEDYFYIIADLCQWARKRMLVGPARGSSCGSLVCWLLGITTIDPLPHGLLFQRFISIDRADLPDVDIDFDAEKRDLVFAYLEDKYGKERVARLGVVLYFKPRSVLNTAGLALDIPKWKMDKVADAIVERSSGDARALQATEDTLKDIQIGRELVSEYPEIMQAIRMEGEPNHFGQHAAGVCLTETPVLDYVAIDSRTGATHCDKYDAEELGLLKIDALGLTQLSIFAETLKLAELPFNFLDTIPFDDQRAFDVLNKKQYAGIFQFMGLALKSITNQTGVQSLDDIVAITSLARPGPLNNGSANHWIKVKTGREPLVYPDKLFEPYMKDTLGVIMYQEQIMSIGRDIGGLSWEDVSALRKAMSKSMGTEFFDKYGDPFKKGAIERGLSPQIAYKVWSDMCSYGSMCFNKSHAIAYGILSYQCCYLKAHYPIEFAAATLTYTNMPERQIDLLRELNAEGIDYIPVDKEFSTDRWSFTKGNQKKLVGPMSLVKGLGPKLMSQILEARRAGKPMPARALKLLENASTPIDDLWPIKTKIKKLWPNPAVHNIISTPANIIDVQVNGTNQEVLVFCTLLKIVPRDENEEINVAKRNGMRLDGPTASLNLRLGDDTDQIFAKVNRFDYDRMGKPIVERGRAGNALYAIKGRVPPDFRGIFITNIRYIGDLERD
jgi:DNA polymerase III alpha subunit